ncbi:hypothetical protein GCM10027168_52630 [Streptomyces capparidis]
MKRTAALFLATSGLLATALATTAGAAEPADAAAPGGGWERVEGADLGRMTGQRSLTAQVEEYPVAFQSAKNSKFVTTEVTYAAPNTGLQRARATDVAGSWESYILSYDEALDTWALKSQANNKYVAVEKNFTGATQNALRARSDSVGGWERFILWYNEETDRYALQSELNGLFVAMENNYTGNLQYTLRARSTDIGGSWEEFMIYDLVTS